MPTKEIGLVSEPTWYGHIRHMFTKDDINHMAVAGLDLTSYEAVKASAGGIYGQVATKKMPPGDPWSDDEIQTFLNWMSNGYPKGSASLPLPTPEAGEIAAERDSAASRIRKDINTLSDDEMKTLKKAFEGIMALDPKNDADSVEPNSYFAQAGHHWLPGPDLLCLHHVPAYNPWHRAYLFGFENALRSIPGCEDVTLPYWDISTPFPERLKVAPFDKYTLPRGIGSDSVESYDKGYTTTRYPYQQIADELQSLGVVEDLERALTKPDWEDFHGYWSDAPYNTIIAAHDNGHISVGTTLARQSIASFDPIFWFFHCNWDRLWWNWQVAMNATSLEGLLTTIDKEADPLSYQIFTLDPLKKLNPFSDSPPGLITTDVIDSENSLDVDYADPAAAPLAKELAVKAQRFAAASQNIQVDTQRVNVSVKGLNRLKIPGSFKVHLLKDGKRLASRGLFQPAEPEKCETCIENGIAHFDFDLPLSAVQDGTLSVEVEPLEKDFVGSRFPHKLMDNPTIHVELLMRTE